MANLEDQRFNKTYLFFDILSTWIGASDYCEGLFYVSSMLISV